MWDIHGYTLVTNMLLPSYSLGCRVFPQGSYERLDLFDRMADLAPDLAPWRWEYLRYLTGKYM